MSTARILINAKSITIHRTVLSAADQDRNILVLTASANTAIPAVVYPTAQNGGHGFWVKTAGMQPWSVCVGRKGDLNEATYRSLFKAVFSLQTDVW